jgi:histidinol-phosphate phosphatase family protein
MSRRALFCDRDGTLIHDAGYPSDPALVCLMPGAAEALTELKRRGFLLVVVSNQSGVGRGLVTPEQAARVHERFVALLAEQGVELDGVCYCPHSPDAGCACRKPSPGMLLQMAERLRIDLGRSWMVGDKVSDVETGQKAGCRTWRLKSDDGGRAWSEVLRIIRGSSEATDL